MKSIQKSEDLTTLFTQFDIKLLILDFDRTITKDATRTTQFNTDPNFIKGNLKPEISVAIKNAAQYCEIAVASFASKKVIELYLQVGIGEDFGKLITTIKGNDYALGNKYEMIKTIITEKNVAPNQVAVIDDSTGYFSELAEMGVLCFDGTGTDFINPLKQLSAQHSKSAESPSLMFPLPRPINKSEPIAAPPSSLAQKNYFN